MTAALGERRPGKPLLFCRGRYAATAAQPPGGPPEIVDTLLAWPRHADWI
jgi:3-hydroxy-9,10-secoandrosta-1,3,5(10)-triene-9,17-dione monooxygenase reductase component